MLLVTVLLVGLTALGVAVLLRAPRRRMVYVQNSRGDRRITR